jgi:SAM-dependent methyltransferase
MKAVLKINKQISKTPLNAFLVQNPFLYPFTLGFFYREKMRAIHYIAPNLFFDKILEIGGGQGGLTALLYPRSHITNLDFNSDFANAPCNQKENVTFVCGDATTLPFPNNHFATVTMFDVLEHIKDDQKAITEALRVLKPGGFLLVSTPNENWQFPYYKFLQSICPQEKEIMQEWGHVRRNYTLEKLNYLIALPCQNYATFINPLSVLCHDVAFSNLSTRKKRWICNLISPLTWLSYYFYPRQAKGTETASLWQKR